MIVGRHKMYTLIPNTHFGIVKECELIDGAIKLAIEGDFENKKYQVMNMELGISLCSDVLLPLDNNNVNLGFMLGEIIKLCRSQDPSHRRAEIILRGHFKPNTKVEFVNKTVSGVFDRFVQHPPVLGSLAKVIAITQTTAEM